MTLGSEKLPHEHGALRLNRTIFSFREVSLLCFALKLCQLWNEYSEFVINCSYKFAFAWVCFEVTLCVCVRACMHDWGQTVVQYGTLNLLQDAECMLHVGERYRFADLVWMPSLRKRKNRACANFTSPLSTYMYTSLTVSLSRSHRVRWPSFARSMPSDDSASQSLGK